MVRFGIVGTNFVSAWFAAACRDTDGRASATAVYSRDPARGRAFAAAHGVTDAVTSLDALVAAVDAVYIASPIRAHAEQALVAIAAGRHVLVEKTMGASASETVRVLDAAAAAGVVAMEAVRNVHAPTHELVRSALPRLGTLRAARLEKLQYSSRYDAVRAGATPNAFDPALGNSALADIGVYVLQPALDWFGRPASVTGASVVLGNGFEASGSMILGYGDAVIDLAWSKATTGVTPSVIHGEDGALTLDDLAEPSRIVLLPRGGTPELLFDEPSATPAATMVHEVIDFVDHVEAGASDPRWSGLSVASRQLMDAHLAGSAASDQGR